MDLDLSRMIIIATHTEDEREPEGGLTPKGQQTFQGNIDLLRSVNHSLILWVDFKTIFVVRGTRFDDMNNRHLRNAFPGMARIIRPVLLGNEYVTDYRTQTVKITKGRQILLRNYLGFSKSLPPLIYWAYFKWVLTRFEPNHLILGGRGCLHILGAPQGPDYHYSARVFAVDVNERTLWCIIEEGKVLQEPRQIPLQLGGEFSKSEMEFGETALAMYFERWSALLTF